ncbi:MAG: PilZ domain-containing protein [Acidobacteria bacterium]|nr:PilZ domain-containing protein [Acidobacteriota bacterium]
MATQCPKCTKDFSRRIHREGWWEHLLSSVFLYPYRCQICSHRFKAFKPFKRYVKRPVDRRQYQRIETNLPATFSCPGTQGEGRVIDLSVGGCRLSSNTQLKEGTILKLEIRVPDEARTISVEGAIVRTSKPSFVGLQFLRFSGDDQRRLGKVMLKQLAAANIAAA